MEQYLVCRGSPYEIGMQHGRALAADIRRCYDAYCRFPSLLGSDGDRLMLRMAERHRRDFADLLEQLQGIADGASLPFVDILRLNFSLDVAGIDAPHCSNIGIISDEEGALVAKTIDLPPAEADFLFVQTVIPDDGYPYVHYGTAGTVWSEAGLSASGLAHVGSGLVGQETRSDGMCVWFLTSLAFLSRFCSVSEAISELGRHEVAGLGQTLMLADREGDLAVVEMLPGGRATARPQTGSALLHTNHAQFPATRACMCDDELAAHYGYAGMIADSEERLANLTHLTETTPRGRLDLEAILRNHGPLGAICRHGQAGADTKAGAILSPRTLTMWGTMGHPCQSLYRPYRVSELL